MRILIVDDSEANRKVLRVILLAYEHDVVECANGLEAMEALASSTFDALISDVLMPGMDGYRLCSEVRRDERFRGLPIIIVSSLYASADDERNALKAGANRFLSRPLSGKALLEALSHACVTARNPVESQPASREPEILKEYSEHLVTRLKEKSQDLETARARLAEGNEHLRRRNDALERDVAEGRGHQEKSEQLAIHDDLTGLPNRLLLNDRLAMAVSQARRHQRQLAIFFMDLDNFKAINDSMGHAAGDEVLRMVAERLLIIVREEDTLARPGGDEFVLLVTGISSEHDLASVSKKILEAIRAPFTLDGRELSITLSVGVSIFPTDGESPESLLRNADIAMYRSKRRGRNTYQLFTPGKPLSSASRLNLEARLRNALSAGEFLLHYQPIVELLDGQITGVEALLRWQASDSPLISPEGFMPVAEASDLIVPISRWVFRSACSEFARWASGSQAGLTVAINVSTRLFQEPDLVGEISSALEEARLPPDCLDLEITESSAMQDVEYSATVLRRLKDLGVRISLDDFGTGYSSLSHLKRLPIDRIKIDKSFVRNVPTDGDDAAIVSAVIAMAHRLKRTTVAEGVETKDQLYFLRGEGCDHAQGFLFSHPLPATLIETTLKGLRRSTPAPFQHLLQA
jgi:diguanylate cyclase (GGDEF)-like protein